MNQTILAERAERSKDRKGRVAETPHRVTSVDLLRGKRKLIIEHGSATYVLVLTRNGKLILNK